MRPASSAKFNMPRNRSRVNGWHSMTWAEVQNSGLIVLMRAMPLLNRLVSFGPIVGPARGYKVVVFVRSATRSWHHMVAFELLATLAAVSACVVVARKYPGANHFPLMG